MNIKYIIDAGVENIHIAVFNQIADENDMYCIPCFDELARANGLYLYWSCEVEKYPGRILAEGSE